jgi:hypothetical protein
MKRYARLVRMVVVPVAALTILVSSAVPASAASLSDTVSVATKPVVSLFSMKW